MLLSSEFVDTNPLFRYIPPSYQPDYGVVEARGTLKRQLFGHFLAFSESLHQMGPEKPCGARKSSKLCKMGHPIGPAAIETDHPVLGTIMILEVVKP